MTDPRDTQGVSARVEPGLRTVSVTPPRRIPIPPAPVDGDAIPAAAATADSVEIPAAAADSVEPAVGDVAGPLVQRTAGSSRAGRVVFPVQFSPAAAEALISAAASQRVSRGAAAYAAIAAHETELRRQLKPQPPTHGSLPAPRIRPRFYTPGGSQRLDLYLSPEERSAVVDLLAELELADDAGRLFRAAVELEYGVAD